MHPWAGLPSRQTLYAGLEREANWDLLIVTARRWRDDYGRIVDAASSPDLRGRLLPLRVGLSGNIPLHYFQARLKRHVREFEPDCIYLYHEPYAVATFQMLRAARAVTSVPIGVRSAQNIMKTYPLPFRHWERLVYRDSDFAVVVSERVAEVMRSKGYAKPISVIPMPVDLSTFFPGTEPATESPLRVGFVGRLVAEKGVDVALKALASLPTGSACLTVIGDGPQQSELRALATSLGVADRVTWRGAVDRATTADAYRHLDVLLVPSRATTRWREQFGRVVIEAAATGVPVIVTHSGELPHLVEDLGAGWVVEEDDVATMAEILCRLCDNRSELHDAGQRARLAAVRGYSNRVVIQQLIDTFVAAVSSPRST